MSKSKGLTIELVEEVLREENSCIASEDVPLIMRTLYARAGYPVPQSIEDEINQNTHDRGDCDETCSRCNEEDE